MNRQARKLNLNLANKNSENGEIRAFLSLTNEMTSTSRLRRIDNVAHFTSAVLYPMKEKIRRHIYTYRLQLFHTETAVLIKENQFKKREDGKVRRSHLGCIEDMFKKDN